EIIIDKLEDDEWSFKPETIDDDLFLNAFKNALNLRDTSTERKQIVGKNLKKQLGNAKINDEFIGVVCPYCKRTIVLDILNNLKGYLNRFEDNFKSIRENASKIDVDYVINQILKGDK
ncbi:MAG TPA: hypothetical protein VGB37_10865, partial [Candidatus Lokiarchaeia archaeon]